MLATCYGSAVTLVDSVNPKPVQPGRALRWQNALALFAAAAPAQRDARAFGAAIGGSVEE